jgi:hypothetical protein
MKYDARTIVFCLLRPHEMTWHSEKADMQFIRRIELLHPFDVSQKKQRQ